MLRALLTLAVLGLVVYALTDLAGTRKDQTGGLPKWLWVVVIVLMPVVGSLVWIVFRRLGGRSSQGPAGPSGPLAPDDDPEFLWRLDQERKRRERQEPDLPN
ncbi:hypothetical protein ET495_15155 [Xylanimonas allomyrinae]|uniref:Cardiolipin synthase N-terminal domain-containing protein n=1 Tax=Xylanimonas allomyrinae TaxID=2509459 RepID=A0A4V0YEI4_9MICO|nr:PLDc N-terminal domain-containing protein [Xylanimonas allomyrinae]QAY64321.1 hypothetical protein ET495_15155 [Xylanimonas allomyrinae]